VVAKENSLDPSFDDDARPYLFHTALKTTTGSS
jgi:hypothetical protein